RRAPAGAARVKNGHRLEERAPLAAREAQAGTARAEPLLAGHFERCLRGVGHVFLGRRDAGDVEARLHVPRSAVRLHIARVRLPACLEALDVGAFAAGLALSAENVCRQPQVLRDPDARLEAGGEGEATLPGSAAALSGGSDVFAGRRGITQPR